MEALSNTFGYSSNISHHTKNLTINWVKKLKAEIDAGRPVLYAANKKDGKEHAFVIDGYEGDLFHINWGWGSIIANNAFYALDSLIPKNNTTIHYTKGHEALFGIEPAVNCSPVYSSGTVASNTLYVEVGGDNVTLGNFTMESSAECYIYSGTQIRLADGFEAKAGSSAHFAIRDVPCKNIRSAMHAPVYAKTMQEKGTGNLRTTFSRELLVWPNPAQDHISIQGLDGICSVVVYSLMGQKFLHASSRDINISNLPNGTYILCVNGREATECTMFIKQ